MPTIFSGYYDFQMSDKTRRQTGSIATIQPVDPFQHWQLEKQCRTECYGGHGGKYQGHADERLAMRGTYLHQLVECTGPLECAEDKNDLHQSGNPRLPHKEQRGKRQKQKHTDQIAIAHEMGAENDKAQDNGNIRQHFLHDRVMADASSTSGPLIASLTIFLALRGPGQPVAAGRNWATVGH